MMKVKFEDKGWDTILSGQNYAYYEDHFYSYT